MALEIRLLDIYNTPSGKLRAIVKYAGQVHKLKCDYLKSKKTTKVSLISMPVGFTSFEVVGISNYGIDRSVTIKLIDGNAKGPSPLQKVRLDFCSSAFI